MAKKASDNSSKPVAEMTDQKKRKKEAKKEARMMLEIEETKSSIQKAEKRLAKAQARLEARTTQLHTLEAELSEFRASHEETVIGAQNGNAQQPVAQPQQSIDE